MALSALVALGLIGIALVGFVAIVTLLYLAVQWSLNARRPDDGASDDPTAHVFGNRDDRNPYAPTSVPAKRARDFGRTAFIVFIIFGTLLTTILILAFAMLSWRWSASV